MLRITAVGTSGESVRLRVEGRLTGRSVEELRRSCEFHALGRGTRLTLDLADVSFADAQGIALLRDLKNRDVSLVNLAPFLALHLQDAASGSPKSGTKALERSRSKS